jgi:hypothetical protein
MAAEESESPNRGPLREVRYSLRILMEEVEAERASSGLGQEMVDQEEIGKLFRRKKKARRARTGK